MRELIEHFENGGLLSYQDTAHVERPIPEPPPAQPVGRQKLTPETGEMRFSFDTDTGAYTGIVGGDIGGAAGGDLQGTFPNPILAAEVVGLANLDPELLPSGTALVSDEALRAIGTAADEAAAGDHTHATLPTVTQKEALAGSDGTPDDANRYVTEDGLVIAQALDEKVANKAQANGYASLDGTGKVPSGQLPATVGGASDFASIAKFASV